MLSFNKSDITVIEWSEDNNVFGYTNKSTWDQDKKCFSFMKNIWKAFPRILKDNEVYHPSFGVIPAL